MSRIPTKSAYCAADILHSLLVNSQLDQIIAYSIQVTLRFIADGSSGGFHYVNLHLLCDAIVKKGTALPALCPSSNERGMFLKHAHPLIGEYVRDVKLESNGDLILAAGNSTIELIHLDDYPPDGNWAWKVEREDVSADRPGGPVYVACVPDQPEVLFVCSSTHRTSESEDS